MTSTPRALHKGGFKIARGEHPTTGSAVHGDPAAAGGGGLWRAPLDTIGIEGDLALREALHRPVPSAAQGRLIPVY